MTLRWVVLDPDLNKRATSQICSHAGDAVLYSVTDDPLLASETMPPFSGSFSGMRKSIA